MDNLEAGSYTAKVTGWRFTETKTKKLQLNVDFDVANGHNFTWRAYPESTNEKAKEIMIKALRTMGFQGNAVIDLVESETALDKNKELNVVIEYEQSDNGKMYGSVKWVNEINKMDDVDALTRLKNLDLKADFMAIPPRGARPAETSPDEIPF